MQARHLQTCVCSVGGLLRVPRGVTQLGAQCYVWPEDVPRSEGLRPLVLTATHEAHAIRLAWTFLNPAPPSPLPTAKLEALEIIAQKRLVSEALTDLQGDTTISGEATFSVASGKLTLNGVQYLWPAASPSTSSAATDKAVRFVLAYDASPSSPAGTLSWIEFDSESGIFDDLVVEERLTCAGSTTLNELRAVDGTFEQTLVCNGPTTLTTLQAADGTFQDALACNGKTTLTDLSVPGGGNVVIASQSTFRNDANFVEPASFRATLELKGTVISNPDGPGTSPFANPAAVLMNLRTLSGEGASRAAYFNIQYAPEYQDSTSDRQEALRVQGGKVDFQDLPVTFGSPELQTEVTLHSDATVCGSLTMAESARGPYKVCAKIDISRAGTLTKATTDSGLIGLSAVIPDEEGYTVKFASPVFVDPNTYPSVFIQPEAIKDYVAPEALMGTFVVSDASTMQVQIWKLTGEGVGVLRANRNFSILII